MNGTPLKFMYSTTLRLPEGFSVSTAPRPTACDYIRNLCEIIKSLRPSSPREPSAIFLSRDLESGSHVFLCRFAIRQPLTAPYEGPFPILSRADKMLTVDARGLHYVIMKDRLKPAHVAVAIAASPLPCRDYSFGARETLHHKKFVWGR